MSSLALLLIYKFAVLAAPRHDAGLSGRHALQQLANIGIRLICGDHLELFRTYIHPDQLKSRDIAPETHVLPPRSNSYYNGSKRTKVHYGPYSLPAISSMALSSWLTGEQGTMSGITMWIKTPCEGPSNLLCAQEGLEYANGTEADLTTSARLHHIVVLASGSGRQKRFVRNAGRALPLLGQRTNAHYFCSHPSNQ